jgi:hypothetical protein
MKIRLLPNREIDQKRHGCQSAAFMVRGTMSAVNTCKNARTNSYTIDYPEKTTSIACKEQLKVLARLTSSCIRLVDPIFESEKEHKSRKKN